MSTPIHDDDVCPSDFQRSDVVIGVVNVPELMAPDFAIIRLRNGVCLLVGDEGVNVCNTEADMKAGIVSDGLTFRLNAQKHTGTRKAPSVRTES